MSKPDKKLSELVRAAEGLETELEKLESASQRIRKIRLDSGKNLARATRELNETLRLPEELGAGLLALGTAMQAMQARQQAALEPLSAFAQELQRRMSSFEMLQQAFGELGQSVRAVLDLLEAEGERLGRVEEVKTKLQAIEEDARALVERARADDFPDLVRETDALRQRVSALRKRLQSAAN